MSWDSEKRTNGADSKGREFREYGDRRTTVMQKRLLRRVKRKDGRVTDFFREWFDGEGTTYEVSNLGDGLLLSVVEVTTKGKEPK